MIGRPTDLDAHRSLSSFRAAEARRTLRTRGGEVEGGRLVRGAATAEGRFLGDPSMSLSEALEKARYLLILFAATAEAQSVDRQRGIARVLDDLSSFAE